jgi:hypothetical protein
MTAEVIRELRTTQKKSDLIEIATGRYKYPTNFKELIKAIKWLLKKK